MTNAKLCAWLHVELLYTLLRTFGTVKGVESTLGLPFCVEKNIGIRRLGPFGRHLAGVSVIQEIPLLVEKIFADRIVMSPVQRAHVVGHGKQIVRSVRLLRICAMGRQVQSVQRKIHKCANLRSSVLRVYKALEMDYQDFRRAPELQLLPRGHEVFAAWAIPQILTVERLFGGECFETIGQMQAIGDDGDLTLCRRMFHHCLSTRRMKPSFFPAKGHIRTAEARIEFRVAGWLLAQIASFTSLAAPMFLKEANVCLPLQVHWGKRRWRWWYGGGGGGGRYGCC